MQTQAETKSKQTAPPPVQAAAAELPPIESICTAIRGASSDRVAWKNAAQWLAAAFQARYLLGELDGRTGSSTITTPSASDASWQPICDAIILKSRQLGEIVTQSSGSGQYAIVVPLRQVGSSDSVGAIAMAIDADNDTAAAAHSRELMAYVRMFEEAVRNRNTSGANTGQVSAAASAQRGISQASSYGSLHQYAFAITNGLKSRFGCDEVAISILHNDTARILSVSGMDTLHPRSPGTKALLHAMEEAADAETNIVSPDNHGENAIADLPMHQEWLRESRSVAVASIPLRHADEIVGIVSMRRADGSVFSDEELGAADKLVAPLASGLLLLDQANRSLWTHAKHSLGSVAGKWKNLHQRTRTAIVLASVVFVGWMLLGTTTYTLQVPCEVVAGEPLDIAVPFESQLTKAHVRPGDFVHAGQRLVEFDTKPLMAEHQRLSAQLKIAEIATVESLTVNDIAGAGRARNQADAARASLAMISEQIGQAIVVAPFDGYVIEGDVLQRVGETLVVGTELLQLAAADKLAVDLRVDEAGATYVARGMTGEFSTLARPGEVWECEVAQVDASASIVEGENTFMARAEPSGETADWLRPGMQGIARIDTTSKPVWWVYLHGVTDWVRMQAWKL